MANANTPWGFSPVSYMNGVNWTGQGNIYSIPSGDTTAYYIGDPVTLAGSADANGIPTVSIGLAGATCCGAIVSIGTNPQGGPYVDPNNLALTNAPATKTQTYYALVADDPNIVFEIQEPNSGGTALAATNVSENIDFVAGAPAAGIKVSGYTLDNTAHDTTSTRNCKLLRLAQRTDNALGRSAKWYVIFNNHAFRTGVTGV